MATTLMRHWDNQYEFQANRIWNDSIRVRQHSDGRAIVYGVSQHSTQFQNENGYQYKAGKLLAAEDDIPAAIHGVADQLTDLGAPADVMFRLAEECIADLPAEEI